jgi:cytidylate kinase
MPINHKSIVIAIDGPAGAGKSTVAKLLAQKLGLQYLDTGAMYRAIALKAQRNNVTLAHLDAAVTIAKSSEITFGEHGVMLDGEDISSLIPNATLKVFLTASLEERTQRRLKELEEKGIESDYQTLLRQISERDHRDYTREDSPLKIASDAIRLESFGIAPEIVTQQIIDALKTTTN